MGNFILSRQVLRPRQAKQASTAVKKSVTVDSNAKIGINNKLDSKNRHNSVLFVCWANLCRSPAGTAVLKKYIEKSDLDSRRIFIDSAGVELDDCPSTPSFSMRWAAYRRGYCLKHNARRVRRPELDSFDLVIAMDRRILGALNTVHKSPKAKIKLLSEFLPGDAPRDVPDPMNRAKQVCNEVLDMLERACPKIVSDLLGN